MSLKKEIGEIEEEEDWVEQDELELIREQETRDKIAGLYRRIAAIVDYIDKGDKGDKEEEEPLTEEEMWECGYEAGYEEGGKRAIMEAAKEQAKEEIPSSEYAKGYEHGVKKMIDDNKEEIEAIEKALGINVPSSSLTSLLHAIQQGLATTGPKREPEKASGLGKKVGDV